MRLKRQNLTIEFLGHWLILATANSALAVQPFFMGLGNLDGSPVGRATAISADGSTVVGWTYLGGAQEAWRWKNGSMTGLGDLNSTAYAVSADGSVVVGERNSASGSGAFRWQAGIITGLGDHPSAAYGVSADGSVITGFANFGTHLDAFRWTSTTGMTNVHISEGGVTEAIASGISGDGSAIVGTRYYSYGNEAFRWENGSVLGLADLPGGTFASRANAISENGSVVVGSSSSALSPSGEAFRWQSGNLTGLGLLPGASYSVANAVSEDGSVIVGASLSSGGWDPIIWDSAHGLRNLGDVLLDLDLGVSGWDQMQATGISADGLTIVGSGNAPGGSQEGWIAHIPEPASILLMIPALWIRRRGISSAVRR
jgi:probable HAF family extracellular repeat protein